LSIENSIVCLAHFWLALCQKGYLKKLLGNIEKYQYFETPQKIEKKIHTGNNNMAHHAEGLVNPKVRGPKNRN
jgi:hypothetical protein